MSFSEAEYTGKGNQTRLEKFLQEVESRANVLHNNLAKRDIREYVAKRKTRGSTRSEAGRCCRDTHLRPRCKRLKLPRVELSTGR